MSSSANVHVWCELQTPLTEQKPIGKGRSSGIRPDYVLSSEPLNDPRSSVLIVECKQYLRQKRKNFSEALIDYARGHPNAPVLLVNYGPTTSSVLARVAELAPEVRERTHVIGTFRPDCLEALESFERHVQAVIPARDEMIGWSEPAGTDGTVTLTWSDTPADLDLHGWIEDSEGHTVHVYFEKLAYESAGGRLELDADVSDGYGPETLRWEAQEDAALVFAAHNYSDEAPIAGCGARVEATVKGTRLELEVPTEGAGRWWHLFSVDIGSGTLRPTNAITPTSPKETADD